MRPALRCLVIATLVLFLCPVATLAGDAPTAEGTPTSKAASQGKSEDASSASRPSAPSSKSAPEAPAANSRRDEDVDMSRFRATGDAEMVEKLARARREWLDSVAELEEASGDYARALYAAGDDGAVEPAIVARNDDAEARMTAISERIPTLVEEARRDGVSEDVLRLYVEMTTRNR